MAVDDWIQKNAAKTARNAAAEAVGGVVGVKDTIFGLIDRYFGPNFRWVEFTGAVGGSYAAMKALAISVLAVAAAPAHTIALVAAAITAISFLRNPKTSDWRADEDDDVADEPPAAQANRGDSTAPAQRNYSTGPTPEFTPLGTPTARAPAPAPRAPIQYPIPTPTYADHPRAEGTLHD